MKRLYSESSYKAMTEAGNRGRQLQTEKANAKRENYLLNPVCCLRCNKPIEYDLRLTNKFCSHSCSATTSNFARRKTRTCTGCGKLLSESKKYCSVLCQQAYLKRTKIEDWLAGKIDGTTSSGCSDTIRKYLLEQCGYKCPKCGWDEVNPVTKRVPLEINHIDGDPTNNVPANLEVLCPNCHALTPNFRALNKNSTRTYRAKYSK